MVAATPSASAVRRLGAPFARVAAAPVIGSTVARVYRAQRIGSTFARVYLGLRAQRLVARHLEPADMPRRWREFHRDSARSLYATAVELQGLVLKGCQFLGTRADVLPPEAVEVLSRLQDRVPPRPFPVVRRCVERELGRPLETLFRSFSRRPVASASLAQVHEARLPDGRRVAVKVQYPGIESLVQSDLANLRLLFRTVGLLERDLDLMPLVEELQQWVPRELDFLQEAHNAETLAGHFAGRDDVVVPDIHWPYASRRVLVMEYLDGIKISDVAALRAAGLDPDRVVQLLAEAYCLQVLGRGFFHADPHPGNLRVQVAADGSPRLVLLDFGLARELPPGFRAGVVAVAAALWRGDADALAAALLDLGFEARDGGWTPIRELAVWLLAWAGELRSRSCFDRELLERLGRELAEHLRESPLVRVPPHVALLARTLGLLSGVSGSLDARLDWMALLLPYAMGSAGVSPPPRA